MLVYSKYAYRTIWSVRGRPWAHLCYLTISADDCNVPLALTLDGQTLKIVVPLEKKILSRHLAKLQLRKKNSNQCADLGDRFRWKISGLMVLLRRFELRTSPLPMCFQNSWTTLDAS